MIIQIDGINTHNKGAELMLVSILEELDRRLPGSKVYLNPDSVLNFEILPKTTLFLKVRIGLKIGRYINAIFNKLNVKQPIKYFKENYTPKKVDVLLDASGFKYSDQWNRSLSWIETKEQYYRVTNKKGVKIYFLTQAFGPFETENGKKSIKVIDNYCELIFARDKISLGFLKKVVVNKNKIFQSCDFTLKTKGKTMEKFCNLRNSIAIIPNKKMISHGGNNVNKYLKLMIGIVNFFMNKGHNVFLLNHEAEGDLKMCEIINSKVENPLEIVSGLSAKEVKGLIGISRLVVSSRFHGVASALSQGVPCLATSWNHKYKMIFEDFGQKECILNSSDPLVLNLEKISSVYDNSTVISSQLRSNKEVLIAQIDQMWDKIIENFESTI